MHGDVSSATAPHNEIRLFVRDRNNNLSLLVDSGSTLSLLPRSIFSKPLQVASLQLHAANQSVIHTYGRVMLTMDLGLRKQLTWPFIIADVHNAILGADMLDHYGLLVDVKRRRLVSTLTNSAGKGETRSTSIHTITVINDASDHELQQPIRDLLIEFAQVTKPLTNNDHPRNLAQVCHHITTTGPPVYERPRRLVGDKLEAAKQHFDALLNMGVIRPSSSQWANPLHMVAKPSGGWRATGDYRRLNSITVPDRYPIPLIEDLIHGLTGCEIFTVLDLEKAYYQIPVNPEDIPKTAVTTPFGLFEFLVMPLGLRNATQTFQRRMDNLLRHLPFVKCYVDDWIVHSTSREEHMEHLKIIFNILRENRLTINLNKCQLAKPSVTYLGYVIDKNGFRPPQDKIQAIANFKRPELVKDLRRFLGMVNHYRRCIPNAAQLQAPLCDFLKDSKKNDKRKIPWTPDSEAAFQAYKDGITNAVAGTFLKANSSLALVTDASSTAIGAALEQLEDGIWRPLGFFSRKMSPAETRYSTYDRELLAIFAALKFFRHVLEGREFVIKTDHKPITFAFDQRADKASPRQCRQLDFISQFNTAIIHISGEDNAVADTLSRVEAINMPSILDATTIASEQQKDAELGQLATQTALNLQKVTIDGQSIQCDISDGLVRPYLPTPLRRRAFNLVHNLSHPSGRVSSKMLRAKYVWPGIRKDAIQWARQCIPCQQAKVHRHTHSTPRTIDMPDQRFDHVHLDLITLPQVGNLKYCLTIIDRFSRWPTAIPISNIEAETIADRFYTNWICNFGTPLTITTDQGTQFESTLFSALANKIGASKIHTTPYHPQANGMVERWHRTLKAALMCNTDVPWPQLLPTVLLGLRASLKEDIGASPAELLFGSPIRLPGDFFTENNGPADTYAFLRSLRRHFNAVRPAPASNHAKKKHFISKLLDTCTHVFMRVGQIRKSLDPPYSGPHRVINRLDTKRFVIDVNGTHKTVSIDSLKPAFIAEDDEPIQPPPPISPTDQSPHRPQTRSMTKKVSFCSPPATSTRGGVAVASSIST